MSVEATTTRFTLIIRGEPRGQGRPRFARTGAGVRTYTDAATRTYAQRIETEWIAAGRPRLPPGPYALEVVALFSRPASHWTTRGKLSAAGRRATHPTSIDGDNLLKLGLDSMCACGALPDDRHAVDLRVVKHWSPHRVEPGMHLMAYSRPVA